MSKKKYPRGKGPFTFSVDQILSPSDSGYTLNLNDLSREGKEGYYRPYLPMDFAEVTNLDPDNPVSVHFNNQDEGFVVPNSTETFTEQTFTNIRVENIGGTNIAADDIKIQVELTSYGADAQAQDRANTSLAGRALSDLVPGI